ncbi:hypothetical protein Tco_1134203 [Tanacetum coccineum]
MRVQSDRERAKAMIQAIEKMLKSRRIMRSLDKFVGGRPYEDTFKDEQGDTVRPSWSDKVLKLKNLKKDAPFINAHLILILEAIEEISYYQLIELLAQGIEARAIRTGFLGHSLRKSGLGSETTKIQGTEIPQSGSPPKKVDDEVVHKELGDIVEGATTTTASLDVEQDSSNILKPQSTEIPNTRSERVPTPSYDSPLLGGNTAESDEERLEQDDLTDFVPPTPHDSPLSGGFLPEKHQRLLKIWRKSLDKENVSKQGRNLKTRPLFEEGDFDDDIDDIDDMVNEAMDNVKGYTVNTSGAVNTATTRVSAASASVTIAGMRSEKAKEKRVTFRDVEESARSTIILLTINPKDKGEGIMQEHEKPLKNLRKAQIQMDEEMAMRLQEEENAELERIMDADALLAARLQEEEREQFSINEQARFLVETIAERRGYSAAQRMNKSGNKPPTKSLKKQDDYLPEKHGEQKWINDFVPIDSEVVKDSRKGKAEGSRKKTVARKRTGEKIDDESVKRQKIEDDDEKEELRAYLDIIPGDDEVVNVESLATKYPIVKWKTHILTENIMYYQIIRADGSFKNYKIFSEMLDDFDRQDVLDLYRLVKERFETTSLEGYDRLLCSCITDRFQNCYSHADREDITSYTRDAFKNVE